MSADDAPVLGIVENVSYFACPNCEDDHELFGSGGCEATVEDYDVPMLARLPVQPDFDTEQAEGPIVRDDESEVQDQLVEIAETVSDHVDEVNRHTMGNPPGGRGDA